MEYHTMLAMTRAWHVKTTACAYCVERTNHESSTLLVMTAEVANLLDMGIPEKPFALYALGIHGVHG